MIGTKPILLIYLFLTRNITITKLIIKSRIFASLANQSRKVKVPKVETEEGGTSFENFVAVPKLKQKSTDWKWNVAARVDLVQMSIVFPVKFLSFMYRYVDKKKSYVDFDVSACSPSPLLSSPLRVLGRFTDITEKKNKEL